jgi:hypothetical protein
MKKCEMAIAVLQKHGAQKDEALMQNKMTIEAVAGAIHN